MLFTKNSEHKPVLPILQKDQLRWFFLIPERPVFDSQCIVHILPLPLINFLWSPLFFSFFLLL